MDSKPGRLTIRCAMQIDKRAAGILVAAVIATIGHAWMPEPWDIAAITLAWILGGAALLRIAVARAAKSS